MTNERDSTMTPMQSSTDPTGLTNRDIKALNLVQEVLEYMAENKLNNYQKAFRQMTADKDQTPAALSRAFYDALARPAVKLKVMERIRMRDTAWLEMLGMYMGPVLQHAFSIAIGEEGYARDAVAAQRFLYQVYRDMRDLAQEEEVLGGLSPAASFMEQFFSDKAKYKAKRSRKVGNMRVEEEIEGSFPSET